MQERQSEALREFADAVLYGRELAAACAIGACLAEREPVPYTLSPLAEGLLSTTQAPRHSWRRRLNRLGQRVCDLIDETLYSKELAISRYHQAAIDQILSDRAARS